MLFTENIYAEHLAIINGISFTPREIAVIACLLHARGTSRIASFLSIAPRTVVTHIRNIMLKLECNSRENIIDFIEKSHKIPILRTYYETLVIESAFERSLQEISRLRHEENRSYILVCWVSQHLKNDLLHQLKNHLSKARINVEVREQKSDQNLEHIENVDHTLLLLLEKEGTQEVSKDFSTFDSVDLSEQENYYFAAFEIIKTLLPSVNLESVLTHFKERSEGMIGSASATALQVALEKEEVNNSKKEFSHERTNIINEIRFKELSKQKAWPFRWGFLIIMLFGVGFLIQRTFLTYGDNPNSHQEKSGKEIRSDLIMPTDSVLLQRSELMDQIKDTFKQQKTDMQTVALTGIGGSGKTTAARQYAYKQNASVVWEINAETKTSLNESFKNLAYALAINEEDKRELSRLQEVKNSMEREKKLVEFVKNKLRLCSNWFLIYDNVENFSDIQKYFPLDAKIWGHGRIILTTRDSNMQNNKYINCVLHVGELNESQKLHLFTQIMSQGTQNTFTKEQTSEANRFLKAIPPFPLDVSLASYYIKTTNIPYNQYIELLEKNDEDITTTQESILKESGDYSKTRYNIITLSLEKLIAIHKDFGELLLFISLLDSQNIPKKLLNWYKSPSVVDNFIYHLKKHSLITMQPSFSSGEPTLSLHRSTQRITLAHLTREKNLEKNKQEVQNLAKSLNNYVISIIESEDFPTVESLINHCEKFLSHKNLVTLAMKGIINGKLGGIYYYTGDYIKARETLKASLLDLNASNNTGPTELAWSLTHLGIVFRELGDYKEAKNLLEKGLRIYKENDPHNYPKIARTLRYLGIVHKSLGNYEKSRDLLEQSVLIFEKQFPENHMSRAWSLALLGSVYRALGDYKKAKNLLEKSLVIYRQHFPENHVDIAWVFVHLGNVYKEIGNYKEAKALLEKSLMILKDQLPEGHSRIAWTLSALGNVSRELHDYVSAKKKIEQSISLFRKYFPYRHLIIEKNLYFLGKIYTEEGEYEKAKKLIEESLLVYEKHYGKDHIETAQVLESLGQVYLVESNLKIAENCFLRALRNFQKYKHPKAYVSLEDLATLYLKKSEEATRKNAMEEAKYFKLQAINDLKQALEIVKTHFPVDSPHITRIQDKIKRLEGK